MDDDDGVNSELPEITMNGENTLGCRINGQVFLPRKRSWCLDCPYIPKLSLKYGYLSKEGYRLSIFTNNDIDEDVMIGIDLFNGDKPFRTGEYLISETNLQIYDFSIPNATCWIDKNINGKQINSQFQSNSEITGTLNILKIDEDKKIISGTFEFQAIDLNGEIIDVTDGRFDIIYETGF